MIVNYLRILLAMVQHEKLNICIFVFVIKKFKINKQEIIINSKMVNEEVTETTPKRVSRRNYG